MLEKLALAFSYGIIGAAAFAVADRLMNDGISLYNFTDNILPPCQYEDEQNCYWDAQRMGDGNGWSFININGTYIYFEHMEE